MKGPNGIRSILVIDGETRVCLLLVKLQADDALHKLDTKISSCKVLKIGTGVPERVPQ